LTSLPRSSDRHRSTIFREVARNKFEEAKMPELSGYFCVAANGKAKERRSRYRKLVRHPELRASIIERIKHGWSPEQIAGRLAYERSSVRVCHDTIYRFAYSSDGQELKLWRYLPESRARRRPRHARRRHGRRFSPELSILHRPDIVRDRKQLGHWECDLI
jgi:IS30 family transposase